MIRRKRRKVIAEITELLERCRQGDRAGLDDVFALLYAELRRIALGKLGRSPSATLTPTALVHEAYVRLAEGASLDVVSRRHFFTSAARAMRHILVDRARRASSAKRGGGRYAVTWDDRLLADAAFDADVLDIDRALGELTAWNDQGREIVELRYFAGLSAAETANVLDISLRTVHRTWRRTRAFLHARLEPSNSGTSQEPTNLE